VFEMSGVSVAFGGLVALTDVDVVVEPNQVLGVIGPNGAGKTTLFNVACGFVRPDTGVLRWRGTELRGLRPHQLSGLGIARTLQELGLFDRMTVLENVLVGARRHASTGFASALFALPRRARDERARTERAMAALTDLGIDDVANCPAASLPYPVRKRIALARALAGDPDLLLLDEPASGLGADELTEIGALVRGLAGRMSVMLVEHHMDLVMSVCDHIVVLDFGKVIARGAPADIQADAAVAAAYLGDAVEERPC